MFFFLRKVQILMDRLGPDNFSTLQMKGHVNSPRNDPDPEMIFTFLLVDPEMIPNELGNGD